MAVSIPEIKKAAARIADFFGVSYDDAIKIMPYYKADGDIIRSIIAGDFSTVPGAAASVGVVLGGPSAKDHIKDITPGASAASVPGDGVNTSEKITAKRSRKETAQKADNKPVTASKNNTDINGYNNTLGGSVGLPECVNNNDVIKDHASNYKSAGGAVPAQNDSICINDGSINNNAVVGLSDGLQDINGDIIPTVYGEIMTDSKNDLPPGFSETVRGWLLDIQAREGWEDLTKISGLQWRAVCSDIGNMIKKTGVLLDTEKLRTHGGSIAYNPYKVEKLLYIWDNFTCKYKHAPILSDFINFAGVSREWFYDTHEKLSSRRVDIVQKARAICEGALESGLMDAREVSTGRIFTAKARYGWQETTTIQHVTAAAAPAVSALPVFDGSAGLLTDSAQ